MHVNFFYFLFDFLKNKWDQIWQKEIEKRVHKENEKND